MSDTGNLIIRNELIVEDASMTASFTSLPQDISSTRSYAVEATWSGATGASSADLFTLSGGLTTDCPTVISEVVVDETEGSILINVEFPSYPYIKVGFTKQDASAGTMDVRLSEKI